MLDIRNGPGKKTIGVKMTAPIYPADRTSTSLLIYTLKTRKIPDKM
jgi:hypothetical protein